jgi:adhesin/invasin
MLSQPVVSGGILYATYANGDVIAWGVPATSGGSPALAVSQSSLQFLYTGGGPAPSAQTVAVSSNAPPATFTVASDSPWLTTDVQSAAAPATVTVRANPVGLNPGVYSGSLDIFAPGNSPVTVQVTLVVHPTLPSLASAGIVNAASYQKGLAPGSLFTIFANTLSGGTFTAASAPWATSWNGISVKINGIAAPLGYVSPTQINAQVPFEIGPGTAQLTIASNGTTAGPVALTIQSASPGVFMYAGGRAPAINQDGTLNLPTNPASVGSYISVYLTGQGMVDQPVLTGAAAPIRTIANTLAQTTATIGGVAATVPFSGLAPGYVGLGQVNLLVPNVPAGDQQVIVTIGGVASNPAMIAVTK